MKKDKNEEMEIRRKWRLTRFRKSLKPGLTKEEIDEMRDFMKRADHHLEKN